MTADLARDLYQRVGAEPYRTKVVEKIRLPDRSEREQILKQAFYSPAYVNASDVYVDMATDSGSGAMSNEQWAALMRGDEAYVRSKSFFAFEKAVRDVTGFQYVIPTHQGRAAENILMELLVRPDSLVLANTHFDTTKAHVEHRKALALDLVDDRLWNFAEPHPFKGDFDLTRLETALDRYHDRVALVVITVTNNMACSSPVSMKNIREVRRLADKHGIMVLFDASRFAENAYFIKTREPGYATTGIPEIAREMFSYGHGCWMSAKKDAIVNIGGFIALNDPAFARRCQEKVVLYEGFYTYGGLARRDLEAIAVGIYEGLDEDYLAHRTGLVRHLGDLMERAGIVVSKPVGGSGVFIDVEAMYPHLSADELPSIAMSSDLYLEGGVRAGAFPFRLRSVSAATGDITERVFQFARFAVPRRVYSRAHIEYVGEIMSLVKKGAQQSRGYQVVETPETLGHYFVKFEPRRDNP